MFMAWISSSLNTKLIGWPYLVKVSKRRREVGFGVMKKKEKKKKGFLHSQVFS